MSKNIFFKDNIFDFLFVFLILVLPFSKALTNIIIAFSAFLFIVRFEKKKNSNYFKSPFFILAILVLYLYFQAIINGSFFQDFGFYKKYLYLIIIPVLFLEIKNTQLLKLFSIIVINITIFISIFKIFKFYYYFNYLPLADGWATNTVLYLERPYAGLFSVICLILSCEQIITRTKSKFFFIFSFALSFFFLFFISIRISLITLFVIVLTYVFFYMKMTSKKKIFLSIFLMISLTSITFLNKNIAKRFFIDKNISDIVQTIIEFEPRIVIWRCADLITEQKDFSVFFGTNSYSDIKNSLINCYSDSITDNSRRNWFLVNKFNTHNQFIDLYLIGGLIAFLIFIIFLTISIINNHKSFFSVAIFITFTMVLLIENIFHRQFGCLIFSIFTSLYFTKKTIKDVSN